MIIKTQNIQNKERIISAVIKSDPSEDYPV